MGIRLGTALVALSVAASCGSQEPASSSVSQPIAVPSVTPAGPGDVQVATVNGRPVWSSCVQQQAHDATNIALRKALDECIDFELLAEAAEAAKFDADRDLQFTLRRTLASAMLAKTFEPETASVTDLPAKAVQRAIDASAEGARYPEWREALYVRVNVDVPGPGSLGDQAALALATRIYEALPVHHALFAEELFATAEKVGGAAVGSDQVGSPANGEHGKLSVELSRSPYRTPLDGRTEPPFAKALFALGGISDVSPPTRTRNGWDLIYLSNLLPAANPTREELAAQLFPDLRRGYFPVWLANNARDHDVAVDVSVLERITAMVSNPPASAVP